jgi:hypothetical protein
MNCAITAHHMHDWVWVDFLKANKPLRSKLNIKNRDSFIKWIGMETSSATGWWVLSSSPTVSTTQSLGWSPCKNSRIFGAGLRAFARPARLQ